MSGMRTLLCAFVAVLLVTPPCLAAFQEPDCRVWDSHERQWVSFDGLIGSLSNEDVVFVGEVHDDPATHRFELALFEGLSARRKTITLGLEMFERDVQTALDDYRAGRIAEPEFLKRSRPWNNYATDYRPLVETARAARLPVVGTNLPQSLARAVAREGLAALDNLPADHRWLHARHTTAPKDDYWKRFTETMKEHVGADSIERYYVAQCLKDDTMAESIADWLERAGQKAGLFVHLNGAFHSDENLGIVPRTQERMPKARIATVRIVPVENLSAADSGEWAKAAKWIVFVKKQE